MYTCIYVIYIIVIILTFFVHLLCTIIHFKIHPATLSGAIYSTVSKAVQ